MKKYMPILSTLLAAVLMLTACGGTKNPGSSQTPGNASVGSTSQTGTKTPADTLRVVLNSEPSNIDPHNNTRLTSWAVQEEVFDKLVTKDENGNIMPDLATEWEQVDERTWRFHLRDGVTFHDGSELTAEDVAFSLKRA